MSNNLLYGIWLRGKGWLRDDRKGAISFADKSVADEVAKRVGDARVFFIDKSLEDIEQVLIDAEKRTVWRILTNFLQRKTNK